MLKNDDKIIYENMRTILLISILQIFTLIKINSQDVIKIGEPELKAMLSDPTDKLHVLNFWATWCGPCLTEIPYFEQVAKEYQKDKVEIILASLDFPSQFESKLIPFIRKHKISLKVVLIEELDYDKWMRDVDSEWQGNIPATLFFNNAKKSSQFVNRPLDDKELRIIIDSML